jgi:hypothetical protein
MAPPPAFTAEAQQVNDAWNAHLRTEFSAHSAEEALATMVAHPRVNQVPVMNGVLKPMLYRRERLKSTHARANCRAGLSFLPCCALPGPISSSRRKLFPEHG